MTNLVLLAQRGWSKDIARIIRGEPGAWPRFLISVAIVGGFFLVVILARNWWINNGPAP